jgi:hypothetical protein
MLVCLQTFGAIQCFSCGSSAVINRCHCICAVFCSMHHASGLAWCRLS